MKKAKDKKIKLGIFVEGDFIPSYDGASNRFHYLSRYLQWAGVEVVVFHGFRGWSDLELIKKEPFKTYVLPIERYYKDSSFLASLVKKEKLDIIQFNDLEPVLLQGIRLAHMTGVHLVAEMHFVVGNLAKALGTSAQKLSKIAKLEKFIGRAVDHVIALSSDDEPDFIKKMGVPSKNISVVPSGVDLREIKFWGPNFKAKTILFLGNLYFEPNGEAVKTIHRDIYPELKKAGFKFLIVGDCPKKLRDKYQDRTFRFTGTVDDLNQVFKESTLALAPIIESTGLRIKTLNYLAAGIPVVTTSASAAGFPHKDCLLVEDDFQKYPALILKLTKRELLRLAKRGRETMESKFDWKIIAERTKTTYKKILHTRPKDKAKSAELTASFNLKEPVWLEEAKKKGRFSNCHHPPHGDFSYGVIRHGRVNIVR